MRLTDPIMPATHKPYTSAAKSSQPPPPSPAVTRQRFAEEDLLHLLTAIDLDSYMIEYVIVDNGIWKVQTLFSMTKDWLAKMKS